MTRILYLSTGRRGRRRRTLIAQNFLIDKAATHKKARSPASLPSSLKLPTLHRGEPLESDWLDNWDLPKLTALAESQSRRELFAFKREIKGNQIVPGMKDIPAENALGLPLGAKATRRHVRKWYKRVIDKIMAPVPREEWEAFGRLARGKDKLWEKGSPARRTMCGGGETKEGRGWDWKAYAVEPVRSIERGQSRKMKGRTGEQGEAPYGLGNAIGLNRYERARLWRRLYGWVWEAMPTMEAVENGKKWKIEWGEKEVREVPLPMPAQMAFFEGAPEGAGGKGGRGIRSKQTKKLGLAQESRT